MKRRIHKENLSKRILLVALALLSAVLSFTFAADRAMSAEKNAHVIESLDDKKNVVLTLTGSATVASAVISAIPSDTATPIAEKLADLSGYFLIILTVLYAEKYLLTAIGAAVFKILIPFACIAFIIFILSERTFFRRFAARLLLFGILLYITIPAGVKVSDMIYQTYQASINNTIESAEQLSNEADAITEEDENLWDKIAGAANNLKSKAASVLTNFTEVLAIMVATTCVIPILVLLFFIWLMKTFLGINISMERFIYPAHHGHHGRPHSGESKNDAEQEGEKETEEMLV